MLYNKNKVRKTNDKKVLHKVGKQWKVVSVALLMAIGGGVAVANTPSANASSTAIKDGRVTSISSRLPKLPRNTKANLLQSNDENDTQSQGNQSAVSATPQSNSVSATSNNVNNNTSTSTTSNGSNSSLTDAELIQSLDAVPNAQGTQSNTNSNVSGATTSNNSESTQSNNSSAQVSYLNGDYGSAASYHAKAETLSQVVQSQSAMVQKYTNSLNAKFPTQMKSLSDATATTNQQLTKDQNASTAMNKIASASNRNSAISEAAQANNQTVSDFVQSITDATNFNTANVSNASNYASYANAVKSNAQLIQSIRTNPAVSENYRFKEAMASANYILASNKANDAKQLASHDATELSDATNASLSALTLNTNDQIALINSQADSLTVHNLATKLGYNNDDTITKLGIQSAADTKGGVSSNGTVTLRTASGSNSQVNVNSVSDLSQVLSDTSVMDHYQSDLAKLAKFANLNSISAQASSANSAVEVANAELSSAKSASVAATKLANNPNYSDILYINMGTSDVGSDATNSINSKITSLQTAKNNADASFANASSADSSADGKNSLSAPQSASLKTLNDTASTANSNLNDALSLSATISNNNALLQNNFATTNGLVSLFPSDTILNADLENLQNVETNSSAENSAMTKLNNDVTSLDNNYTSASSTSAGYSANADVTLVEAPSAVASLNTAIKSDKAKVASASNAVVNFDNTNAPSGYASLKANVAKASTELTTDSALATAYATHVYNYAPKYITNVHRMALHMHTDFAKDLNTHLQLVPKGSHLQVLGVGFAKNGMARYVVDFNGQRGFVTASKAFNKPEYLMQTGQHAKFNVLKNAVLYDSKTGTKPVGKVHVGQTVNGTVYAEPDNNFNGKTVYGAYTRIKLDNGDYLTANTSYVNIAQLAVTVTPKSNNKAVNNSTTPNNVNTIGFINF